MNGIAFIFETFNVKQSTIANVLNLSRMSVSNWVNGKKPVPKERAEEMIEKIPMFKGLNAKYFMKDSLSPSEKLDIQIMQLHYTDEAVEIEDTFIDEEGEEHVRPMIYYTNQSQIHFLMDKQRRLQNTENIIKDINFLLIKENDMEDVLQRIVRLLKNKDKQMVLKLLVDFLYLDNMEIDEEMESRLDFYTPEYVSRFVPNNKEEFAKDLIKLLFKHGITSNDLLKDYLEY